MSETGFVIRGAIAGHLSAAFHQNAVPLIHEIVLHNGGAAAVSDVEVAIASEPAFAKPLTIRIDAIAAGTTHHLRTPDLALDAGFLRNVTETIRGSVTITATSGGATLAGQTFPIELLPPSHWGGSAAAPELLAAFVRPNDPAVDVVLHDAAARLAVAGRGNEIAGYAAGSRQRAWEAAGAIWSALAGRSIAYVLPPASFEQTGQKVRSPSDILERCLATCLDSALLFAACLEQAHLNPLVVLTKGHAFVGLWLKDDGFSAAVVDDGQVLRKRRDLDDLIFIETTLLTQTPPARFRQAVEHAAKLLDDGAPSALEFALDVKRARTRGIRPLDLAEPASPPAPTERPRSTSASTTRRASPRTSSSAKPPTPGSTGWSAGSASCSICRCATGC